MADPTESDAHFLYSGQSHDCVPRALLLDRRLTPSERNAWQVIRLLTQTSTARGPRYEELQTYLSNVPGGLASRETVARVLRLLRLTRWLSSVPRGRDARSGRLLGSLYVLHEEPLTPAEALELDPAYLQLLSSSLTHAAKAVRIVAAHVFDELKCDEHIEHQRMPTRLELLAKQIHAETVTKTARRESRPGVTNPVRIRANRSTDSELGGSDPVRTHGNPGADSEPGVSDPVRMCGKPGSDSEPSRDSGVCYPVRNPNSAGTVRTDTSICISTVPRAHDEPLTALDWPDSLRLNPGDRRNVLKALSALSPEERQAILAEAGARCASGGIRRPAAYLMGLIKRATRGEFNPWMANTAPTAATRADTRLEPPPPRPTKRQPGDPVSSQVQACLEEVRRHSRSRANV